MTEKQKREQTRRDFLLSFFSDQPLSGEEHYEEKQVNDFWLIKQWDGVQERWQVAIFSQESFDRRKEYLAR